MTECLLFDCDGTLVDSERLCHVALARQFREHGIELDVDELVVRFRGWQLAKILASLSAEYRLTLSEDFIPSYRAVVARLFEAELKPVEGVHFALDNLDQPKAVVSSGPAHKIEQALRLCGLEKYFGGNIYSSYDVGIWKPNPGIYRHAAAAMGFSVAACSAVDDSAAGVEAACNAGMQAFFYNPLEEACAFPAAISFRSMWTLPGLIRAR